ncbi:complement factor B-like [Branchiostoma lanceolatum]|uniref:complement factor B-like n=1 Tax=Branchiostoma lanceolatum TaxID=7740 RepID=UPI003453454B
MKSLKLALVLVVAAALVWESDAWWWRRRPTVSNRCSTPTTSTGVSRSGCWWPYRDGETCDFACAEGHERVSGNTSRTCESGSWSGEALVCERTSGCSSPPYPSGAWRSGCSYPYTEGEVCTYTCFSSWGQTSGNNTRTCTDGQWSGDILVCERTGGCNGWFPWWCR